MSDPERRAELVTQMGEKTADLEVGLADYEPFLLDGEAMSTFAATRAEYVQLVDTQLLPAADRGDLRTFAVVQSEQPQSLLQSGGADGDHQ